MDGATAEVEYPACPHCGCPDGEAVHEFRGRTPFHLVRCGGCGQPFLSPHPDELETVELRSACRELAEEEKRATRVEDKDTCFWRAVEELLASPSRSGFDS
jgi:hypothetical protein